MAIILRELLEPQNVAVNSATRSFVMFDDAGVGITIFLARVLVFQGLYPLPAFGSAYDTLRQDIVVTDIAYGQDNNQVSITVTYGEKATATFDRDPVDTLGDNFKSLTTNFRSTTIPIQSYQVNKMTVKGDDSTSLPPVEKNVWQPSDLSFSKDKTMISFSFKVNGSFTENLSATDQLAIASSIREQADKLHRFGDTYYLFRPQLVNQETGGNDEGIAKWRIEYNWLFDPGIEVPLDILTFPALNPDGSVGSLQLRSFSPINNPDEGNGLYFPIQDSGENVWLAPWTDVVIVPNILGPEWPPIPLFLPKYSKDDLGWLTLPGMQI